MYLDVAALWQQGVFESAKGAVEALGDMHLNRKKVAAVQRVMDTSDKKTFQDVPAEFLCGRTHRGLLNETQKQDLLTHVQVMQKSNTVFTKQD